jgi:hypothetical protein
MIVTISGSALPPVCRRAAVRVSGPVRKKSLVLDRTLTRRKQPLAGDALRLLHSLERRLIATAAAEADRNLAEEEAAWNAAWELVDPPRRDT